MAGGWWPLTNTRLLCPEGSGAVCEQAAERTVSANRMAGDAVEVAPRHERTAPLVGRSAARGGGVHRLCGDAGLSCDAALKLRLATSACRPAQVA
jgi:hypothetical protein